jgi:hypothetical protein
MPAALPKKPRKRPCTSQKRIRKKPGMRQNAPGRRAHAGPGTPPKAPRAAQNRARSSPAIRCIECVQPGKILAEAALLRGPGASSCCRCARKLTRPTGIPRGVRPARPRRTGDQPGTSVPGQGQNRNESRRDDARTRRIGRKPRHGPLHHPEVVPQPHREKETPVERVLQRRDVP